MSTEGDINCLGCGEIIFTVSSGTIGFKAKPGAKLEVHEGGMVITDINKEQDTASVICPACGRKTPVKLSYLKRF
ncbi:MAG: hypothetical protein A2W23_04310 [Planctomycetes bacterium RBG_16_43_13]|nr:MAG: hypothetical protein A2W23_04310 [Planctomycetes bacterium RBG_16_43_13]